MTKKNLAVRNLKPVNLMRPVIAFLLIGFLLPHLIKALND